MIRRAEITRKTNETNIHLMVGIDGKGQSSVSTKIGFFDHMVTQIARHGFLDLEIHCEGDTEVDCHHTIEDVGIVFGKALAEALQDKTGMTRYGQGIIPMDETLMLCALDFSGRPYLNFDVQFTTPSVGDMDTEMVEEFFRAVAVHGGLTLHFKQLAGRNNHHVAEAVFKSFGKALQMAVAIHPRLDGVLSTKGLI